MVLFASGNWPPKTAMDAVAVAPEPASVATPNELLPRVNEINPVGGLAPLEAFTVAVTTVDPSGMIVAGFAASVVVVGATGMPLHAVIRLYASTEPRPVTRS